MTDIKTLIEEKLGEIEATYAPTIAVSDGNNTYHLEIDENVAFPCCIVDEEVDIIPKNGAFEVTIMFYLCDIFGDNYDDIIGIQTSMFDKAKAFVELVRNNTYKLVVDKPKKYSFRHSKTNYQECGVMFEITFTFQKC